MCSSDLAYGYCPPTPVFKPGSPEWNQDQTEQMREKLCKQTKEEQDALKDEFFDYERFYNP